MGRRTYRAPDPMLTMKVNLPEGTTEQGRQRCQHCRFPLVKALIHGRVISLNPDGSPHRGTCQGILRKRSMHVRRPRVC